MYAPGQDMESYFNSNQTGVQVMKKTIRRFTEVTVKLRHSLVRLPWLLAIAVAVVSAGITPDVSAGCGSSQIRASVYLPAAPFLNATGIYTDGLDMNGDGQIDAYAGDGVYFDSGDGDLLVTPPKPRGFRILLPTEALSKMGATPFDPTSDWTWIHIPGLLYATAPAVLGQPAPLNSTTSRSVFLYFRVDSNRDGRLSQSDEQYNVRWQDGIYLTSVTNANGVVTYELNTADRSYAELILRTNRGEISKGFYYVPLQLTVTK